MNYSELKKPLIKHYVRPGDTKMIPLQGEYNLGEETYKNINYKIMC